MTDKTEDEIDLLEPEEEYTPKNHTLPIISYNVANTVEVLISKIKNEEIDLKPEFQRDFIWDRKRSSYFIDSLIIGLPIPSIFLGKRKKDESFFVIDGQQRLKTIAIFSGIKDSKFKLTGLENKAWNNKYFQELETSTLRRLNNAVLNTTIIDNIEDDPNIINDIFHRLNTGGMPLNDQEIRNCVSRGSFNNFLFDLNKDENWRNLLGKMSPSKRLNDIELLLRFIALYFEQINYKEPMRQFLNEYMNINASETKIIPQIRQTFSTTVKILNDNIGKESFRIKRYFNRALCDSILLAVARNIDQGTLTKNIKSAHSKLLKDKAFLTYISESTTLRTNLIGRIELAEKYFKA